VTTVHQSFGSTTQDGSTEATDPARVFLDAFADIERLLRQKARADQKVRFVDLVSRLARHDRLVREHDSALRAFASLRNAIAHDRYRSGRPIATPHPDVVRAIGQIRDQLQSPPRIDAFLAGRADVEKVAPETGVWHALRRMTARDLSQVLVYDGGDYVGLLTTNAIARWVAGQVDETGEILAEEAPVAEVMGAAEEFETARFVSRETTVADVIDLLGGTSGHPAPVAVVVTHSGQTSEEPLGILVVHDLPDLLERLRIDF